MHEVENFDHLVYLRVFEGCNLYCRHCFIPANPKKMTSERVKSVPDLLAKKIPLGSTILIQWHGGEPTIFGPEWMEKSIKSIESDNRFKWKHGIQTNLINYSSSWKEIYKKYFDGRIGVSWDAEIRQMKKDDRSSNKEFNKIFDKKIKEVIEDGLHVSLVVTVTKIFFKKFPNPFLFFEWLKQRGITEVHFEKLTKTGNARDNWEELGLTNNEYSSNMSRYASAYRAYRGAHLGHFKLNKGLHISPFDGIAESVERLLKGEAGGYGCASGKCDTKFHTIDENGYKFGCTALTSEQDNKSSPVKFSFVKPLVKIREERQISCMGCEYKPICSSGCLATEIDDGSGECSGSSKLFKLFHKEMLKINN